MAFGDKAKQYHDNQRSGAGDGDQKQFESQWMPTGSGTRYFRPLQAVKDGKLVMAPRLSASGKELREGGKKTGAVLYGPTPADETVFMFAWWNVMVGGESKPKRLMLDPNAGGDPNTAKFKNPLWKHIQENYEKGTRERNAIKLAFALNVWDMTPVMRNDSGQVFYPAEDDTWRLLAFGNNGKLIDPRDKQVKLPEHYKDDIEEAIEQGFATPLNAIRILEGSYGKPAKEGGKHLFAQFEQLIGTFEDGDGLVRNLGEFNLRLTTTGKDIDTVRAIRPVNNFSLLPDEANFGVRYDLETWTKPWPDEAIERLIDGEDFNDIVEEYKLAQFPALYLESTPEVATEAKEEDDEALFDD